MYASPIIIVGLGAFAAQALAGGIDTVIDTTIITITSCAPEVENCPGKTAGPTTSELTETSTYCPPTVSTAVPVVPETPSSAPVAVPPATYPAPIVNASSTTVSVASATPVGPATSATPVSNTSVAVAPPTTSAAVPTSAPVVSIIFSNSTLTAPVLPSSETGILTATGSPSTLTSLVVVPPASTTPESGSATSSTIPKATGASGRLVVPGIMLGLLAVGSAFFA